MKKLGARVKALSKRVLTAISHPLRLDIQCILFNRIASPNEIAKELKEDLSNVSYHVEVLEKDGVIELVDTQPRRGALEHFYKAVLPPRHSDRDWARLPKKTREEITAVTLHGIIGEAVRALNHETFDARIDRHLSHMSIELDEKGREELVERLAEWLEELEQIKAEAAVRLQGGGEVVGRFLAGLMGFETPPGLGLADQTIAPE